MNSALVRKATLADVPEMIAVHRQSFERFFLTQLGPGFLAELYRAFVTDGTCISWVAIQDSKAVGFCVGTSQPNGFFRQLFLRGWWRFLLASVEALARNPFYVGQRLARGVLYRGDSPAQLRGRGTLLSSIAVLPEFSGHGTGNRLLHVFVEEAFQRGAEFVYLTTDHENNESVNEFYTRAGFVCESTLLKPGGRKMARYVLAHPVRTLIGAHS